MRKSYKPAGTCCREIVFEINDDNKITEVDFIGGCPGNLIGLKHLIEGSDAKEIATKLAGIPCGAKASSCPDQFSKAILEHLSN